MPSQGFALASHMPQCSLTPSDGERIGIAGVQVVVHLDAGRPDVLRIGKEPAGAGEILAVTFQPRRGGRVRHVGQHWYDGLAVAAVKGEELAQQQVVAAETLDRQSIVHRDSKAVQRHLRIEALERAERGHDRFGLYRREMAIELLAADRPPRHVVAGMPGRVHDRPRHALRRESGIVSRCSAFKPTQIATLGGQSVRPGLLQVTRKDRQGSGTRCSVKAEFELDRFTEFQQPGAGSHLRRNGRARAFGESRAGWQNQ